jgi:RsiW-degrading membrane proteinase PrsW (M82 family)
MNPAAGGAPRPPAGAPTVAPQTALDGPGHSGGGTLFTVVVSLAVLLGAGVIALVMAGSGAPGALVVGLVLASLPVGPLVACYLWLDRYEPEPPPLLLAAFAWGALVATAAALVLQLVDGYLADRTPLWSATVVAPVTEEAAKGLFVLLLLWWRRDEIDGVLDGLVYAGLVGIGFAFTENILYFAGAYTGGDQWGAGGFGATTAVFVLRAVVSPFAHPLFTSAIGVGVGVAVGSRRRWVRVVAPVAGYAAAVGLHAAWNASAFFDGGSLFFLTYVVAMVPAFLLFVGFAMWARSREARTLTVALDDLARLGLVTRAEEPWLVRLPARRTARAYARHHAGPRGEELTREFQQVATELAWLHHRWLRGTPPRDFAARGAALLGQLRMLRPFAAFPVMADGRLAPPALATRGSPT